VGSNAVWHAGNDGAGSGLDADLLDGRDSSLFMNLYGTQAITCSSQKQFESYTVGSGGAVWTEAGSINGLEVYSDNGREAVMSFHRHNVFAGYFGLGTDNNLRYGGWSYGSVCYKLWSDGNDGAGSGMDADMLDGYHAGSFLMSEVPQGGHIRFGHASQLDTNDGKIGAGLFGTGLNIIGTQTYNAGRQIRLWGSVLDAYDNVFWSSGNDGAGSGVDADMLDGYHASTFLDGKAAAYILFYVSNGYAYTVASSGVSIQSRQQGGIFYFTVSNPCPIGFAIGMATPISYVDGINVMPPAQRMTGNGETYHFEFKYTSSKSLTDPGWALIMWF
jgi:hypothetical protein